MKAQLKPTANQTFELNGRGDFDFAALLERSYRLQDEGRAVEACEVRYAAVQRLVEFIPDDEQVVLEWGHRNSRGALELLRASAVDHFLAGDSEMAAAICEMLLDLDPEDHTGCVALAGLCYIDMEEYELFDETVNDIADSMAEKPIAMLWSSFRRTGRLDEALVRTLRERFGACWEEFRSTEHPADAAYVADIESAAPSKRAQARQLWLQTEHLWSRHPDFIEALRALQ